MARFLPAVLGDILYKVPLMINETNSHYRQAQVAALLELVAGQNTQSAGIEGHGFMQPIFE